MEIDLRLPPKTKPLFEPHRYKVLHGGRGSGKCLKKGTNVIMYDGSLRAVEDVKVGEKVMGPDSRARTVLSTTQGFGQLYRIKQTSGIDYVVNDSHILSLKKSESSKKERRIMPSGKPRSPRGRYSRWDDITNIPVEDAKEQSQRWRSHFRGYKVDGLDFMEQPVLIDPYFFGLWLGDGSKDCAAITTMSPEIDDYCVSYAQHVGNLVVRRAQKKNNKAWTIFLRKHNSLNNPITSKLKEYGVFKNKNIPHVYIQNSKEVRLQLLAGLLDTDGHMMRGGYTITQANEALAAQIKYLADTLGFRTNIAKKKTSWFTRGKKKYGVAWRVSINGDTWRIPCKLPHKIVLEEDVNKNKDWHLSQIEIEDAGKGAWAGFAIDGDHLFLLEDGTVTHNSHSVARALLAIGAERPVRVLCVREFQNSIADSVHKLLSDLIDDLSLDGFYTIQNNTITGSNGTEFIFEGLRHNIQSIKSKEGIDIAWCFPAGTMIDGMPIEEIQEGDYVLSYNHKLGKFEKREVLKTMKRKAPEELYELLTEGGLQRIMGTGEHPVYIKGAGYTPLKKIKKGDVIYAEEIESTKKFLMPRWLWSRDSDRGQSWETCTVCETWWHILFRLCQKKTFREDEKTESNGQPCGKKEDAGSIKEGWAQTKGARRQWSGLYEGTTGFIRKAWSWVVERVSGHNRRSQVRKESSKSLQGGLSKHLLQVSNRVRWKWALRREGEGRRQEERRILREYRVDSVTLQKQEDIKRLGLSDGGDYVYNFEVEVNNNYFANGVLVHNCEEAQTVSKASWEILIPTIREEGSEIWVTFNPELETDDTYQRFIISKPTDSVVIEMNWRDNPWFPAVLDQERLDLKKKDLDAYLHIWEGNPKQALEGAVFAKEIRQATQDKRFTSVPYDPKSLVHTYWDLGYSDHNAIWFIQKVGQEYHVIDFYENQFEGIAHYVKILQEKDYVYGYDFLPHDGNAKELGTGMTIREQMVKLGRNVQIVPTLRLTDGLSALRSVFPMMWFDENRCRDGINHLRRYRYNVNAQTEALSRLPLHDDSSHACLSGDSLVLMSDGEHKRIDEVSVGERVWTPAGDAVVDAAGKVKKVQSLLRLTFSNGHVLECTPEHKIFTSRGLVRADELRYTDDIWTSQIQLKNQRSLSSLVESIGFREAITAVITGQTENQSQIFTERFTSRFMGLFQKVTTSITKMVMPLTTPQATLSALRQKSTSHGTQSMEAGLAAMRTSSRLEMRESLQRNGMQARRGKSGTANTAKRFGRARSGTVRGVKSAIVNIARPFQPDQNIATKTVRLQHLDVVEESQWVYDLTVRKHHCYLANGILVSNSDALRYFAVSLKKANRMPTDRVKIPRIKRGYGRV